MNALSLEELSELVRSIYDCVLTPQRWPQTLERICEAAGCVKASITITAFDGSETRLIQTAGFGGDWLPLFRPEYSHDAARFFRTTLAQPQIDLDMPFVGSRLMPAEAYEAMPVFRDWAKPQGLCDIMSAIVLVTPHRVASVDIMRHESRGNIGDDAIETLRLLVPHLRRAITISDLLDEQLLVAETLRATLDTLSIAAVVVDESAQILEANASARSLLAQQTIVDVQGGRLAGRSAGITRQLRDVIARVRHGEAGMGADSLGLHLAGEGPDVALAHILPLATGDIRTRLAPNAVAAVFITGAEAAPRAVLDGIAAAYRLTEAEARLLSAVAGGRGVPEAAASLGVTVDTGRTHMKHVFAKLGVERHAELVALISRLTPPVRG